MIKSMTGFGRAEVVTKERKITIELKSVNHRYLDLSIKMPRKLNFLEGAVRNLMKTYIQRGKVDVYITYEDYTLDNGALKYNRELASDYITCLKQMQQDFDLDYDIKVSTLSRYPEVLVMEEQSVDEEALWESLEPPLREACEKFVQTRTQEGRNLEKDLIGKLDSLEEKVLRVEAPFSGSSQCLQNQTGSKSFRAAGRHTDRRQPHRSRSHPVFRQNLQ